MNMDLTGFTLAFNWVIQHGYFLMFLGMFIEGPIVTSAAAFASALGYFNIWLVLLISVLGDLIGDVIYYLIGFFSRNNLIEKYGHHIGITRDRVEKIDRILHTHPGKTIFAIKMAPFLPTPGLIITGAARIPLRQYVLWSLIITVPRCLFFLLVGFYFGAIYSQVAKYIEYGQYAIGAIIVIIVVISIWARRISAKISKKIEDI